MSDFMSDFWYFYVGGLMLVSIIVCLILFWVSGIIKVVMYVDNIIGYVWDGDLVEMNNLLFKWWVYLFVIIVIFVLVYGVFYLMFGKFQGVLGWILWGQYIVEVVKVEVVIVFIYVKFNGMMLEQIVGDFEVMVIGECLFMNYCVQCYGLDVCGFKGFFNLIDNDWLGGGEYVMIKMMIVQGWIGVMFLMVVVVGSVEDVCNVVNYVLSLFGSFYDFV